MSLDAFVGTTVKGKFIPDKPAQFKLAFNWLEGKRTIVAVGKWVKNRTNQQNRSWFGIVIKAFMQAMGLDNKDECHRLVCIELGHYEEIEAFGKIQKIPLPTKTMKANEFSELYQKAQRLGAEFYGIEIDDPEPGLAKL